MINATDSDLNVLVKDDGFPWPWYYSCEFNLDKIRGNWQIFENEEPASTYNIEVYRLQQSGESFLMVIELDKEGRVVSRGLTLLSSQPRGVMVPMQRESQSNEMNGYWLHLSWVVSAKVDNSTDETYCRSKAEEVHLAAKITVFGQNPNEIPPKILKKLALNLP